MKYTILLLLLTFCSYTQAVERPNIVFLLTDDQRFDFLGCSGHPVGKAMVELLIK